MTTKYVIELGDDVQFVTKVGVTASGNAYSLGEYKADLEELNSDYINEHYGSLQDDAYHKGLEEGYERGLTEGKKAFDLLDAERDAEYQRGLDDAWEAAKKLFSSMADSDIEKAFPTEWNNGGFNALMNLQPQEAIEKLKVYEEKQKHDNKIEVGDEVEWDNDFTGDRFIVTRIYQPYGKKEQCDGIDDDGDVYRAVLIESLVKTGRHFDIASILKEMQS